MLVLNARHQSRTRDQIGARPQSGSAAAPVKSDAVWMDFTGGHCVAPEPPKQRILRERYERRDGPNPYPMEEGPRTPAHQRKGPRSYAGTSVPAHQRAIVGSVVNIAEGLDYDQGERVAKNHFESVETQHRDQGQFVRYKRVW